MKNNDAYAAIRWIVFFIQSPELVEGNPRLPANLLACSTTLVLRLCWMPMKKRFLAVAIVLALLVLVGILVRRSSQSPGINVRDLESVPENPASDICRKVSQPEDVYYCMAVVHQDPTFCEKMDPGEDKNICLAMANKDPSFCQKVMDRESKQMCYQELSFKADQIDYCAEAPDPDKCYFSFIHRLYWRGRFDEIQAEYCQKLSADAGGNLAYRVTCGALKDHDSALCQGSGHCLSFFEQPLSFCENNKFKSSKADCLRDRALTAEDSSICDTIIDNNDVQDNCYTSYSAHISPNLSLCEKVSNEMTKNMCYIEYAINLSGE